MENQTYLLRSLLSFNPDKIELQRELSPGEKAFNRHDLIARVFHLESKKFIRLLQQGEIFGEIKCFAQTIEWQKRSNPHSHMLLYLKEKITPNDYDKFCSAEIPDKEKDPVLYQNVTTKMIHGPFCNENEDSPCRKTAPQLTLRNSNR